MWISHDCHLKEPEDFAPNHIAKRVRSQAAQLRKEVSVQATGLLSLRGGSRIWTWSKRLSMSVFPYSHAPSASTLTS